MGPNDRDQDEILVYCKECNGYLWSDGPMDERDYRTHSLIQCPYKKADGTCRPK